MKETYQKYASTIHSNYFTLEVRWVIVNVLHLGSSGRVRALTAVIYLWGSKNKSSIKPLYIQVKKYKMGAGGFTLDTTSPVGGKHS